MSARLVLVVLATLSVVHGYKSGAPPEVCGDMLPQHGVEPKDPKTFPYTVKVSKNRIKPGESLDITVSGGKFKGFFLQARVGDTPIGHFTAGNNAKTVDCNPGKHNAVTHNSPSEKNSVRVTWTAPKDLKEEAYIYATVAQNGGVYWVKQKTARITVA